MKTHANFIPGKVSAKTLFAFLCELEISLGSSNYNQEFHPYEYLAGHSKAVEVGAILNCVCLMSFPHKFLRAPQSVTTKNSPTDS